MTDQVVQALHLAPDVTALVKEGAIHINHIKLLANRRGLLLLEIDCKQEWPTYEDVIVDANSILRMRLVTTSTLSGDRTRAVGGLRHGPIDDNDRMLEVRCERLQQRGEG